jgi:hypothetical protein
VRLINAHIFKLKTKQMEQTKQGRKKLPAELKKRSVVIYLPTHMVDKIGANKLRTELLNLSSKLYDAVSSN